MNKFYCKKIEKPIIFKIFTNSDDENEDIIIKK